MAENGKRESWGTEPYRKDMDFSKCQQAEPTDEYGTPKEVANALFHYDKILDTNLDFTVDSIDLLKTIQKGISNEKARELGVTKPTNPYKYGQYDRIAKPQELANMVHHYLDWLRATMKRTWDNRPLNSKRGMLNACMKGLYLNSATHLHYDENPERSY